MKVVYIIDSLASKGGAERILSDKMNYMVDHFGYDVYVITCYQNQQKNPNTYYLSDKVNQINLNIPFYLQYRYHYPKRLWVKWTVYRSLINKLRETVKQINPDVLVALSYFMSDVVTGIRCHAVKLVESHEARPFILSDEGLSRSFFSKAYMKIYRKIYLKKLEHQSDVIVTLTTADAKEWVKAKRVEVVPNFTVLPVIKLSSCENKRVIAVGRLVWQKGFDRLIESWFLVHKKHPDWHLDIFGSGTMEQKLNSMIHSYGLGNVVTIHPYTQSINKEYSNSSIIALSSRYEGFGLVLLEAMQSGLPCVTFDCPYGPSDVVSDNKNGFVVKNGDISAFADKLCILMENADLRQSFSQASVMRSKLFNRDVVMQQWKVLIEELTVHSA